MEKLPFAVDLIEDDYRLRLRAWRDAQPKPGERALKLLFYFLFFLLLAFPLFA